MINLAAKHIGKTNIRFHEDEYFFDIFFDKFKNLLDDYIVNYQIKYFFYFLFISFFYLELSEIIFQFLHNYGPYHLSIYGSFIVDLCYSLFNIDIINFIYSFFAFNLSALCDTVSLLSYDLPFFAMLVSALSLSVFVQQYERFKSIWNLKLIVYFYCVYSFFFFLLFYFGIVSLSFYVYFNLCLALSVACAQKIKNKQFDAVTIGAGLIFLFGFVLPYIFSVIFFLVTIYFSFSHYHSLFDFQSPSTVDNISISSFVDILNIMTFAHYVQFLDYVCLSVPLYILHILFVYFSIIYIYRKYL